MSNWEYPLMRQAGAYLAEVSEILYEAIKPGVTPLELDGLAEEEIRKRGCLPAFKGYNGFPATLCISVNDVIVHGIPDDRPFIPSVYGVGGQLGDFISVDMGLSHNGYYADHAWTKQIRAYREDDLQPAMITVTRMALSEGIHACRPGNRIGDIGAAIQAVAEQYNLGVVREFVGHGIGRRLHEAPSVPNYGKVGRGLLLKPGMALAIEPMFTSDEPDTVTDDNGWTVRTQDGGLATHFEHTVLITETGHEILTAA